MQVDRFKQTGQSFLKGEIVVDYDDEGSFTHVGTRVGRHDGIGKAATEQFPTARGASTAIGDKSVSTTASR